MDTLLEKDPSDPNSSNKETELPKTNFQIYCDEYPDALECRIYDV